MPTSVFVTGRSALQQPKARVVALSDGEVGYGVRADDQQPTLETQDLLLGAQALVDQRG